ncbi:MAG: hypothetical protein Kow00128_00270 [Deltaproteobacteria bacterium]
MYRRVLLLLCGIFLLAALLPAPGSTARDPREERIRKFGTSLGEEVVRDSGQPVPEGKRGSVVLRFVLLAGGGLVVLGGIHLLVTRIRERRRERETVRRYLTENLMTPSAVRDHLRRVIDSRTPVSLWIDSHFIKFSTRIESITRAGDGILLLSLSPAAGNEMIRKSGTVKIEYLYERVPYHFESSWEGEETEGGGVSHRIALPERIEFVQRRDAYRVEPPVSEPLFCTLPGKEMPELPVLDLGMGGFAVATRTRLQPGETIDSVKLAGSSLLPIQGTAKCIYEYSLPGEKSKFRYRYGFRFLRLGKGDDRRLSRYLTAQQVSDLSRRRAMEQ